MAAGGKVYASRPSHCRLSASTAHAMGVWYWSPTGPLWVRPDHTGGQTGNLRIQRLVWFPALISQRSPANLISDKSLLVREYAGEKLGGIWLSPSNCLGTGGSLYLCVSHQFHLLCYYSARHRICGQSKWQCLELI